MVKIGPTRTQSYTVQYNPTELTFDKQAQIAEITIPGLDAPIQQFIRGNAEKLTLEIFCDTTRRRHGRGSRSVTEETDKFYQLVKILPDATRSSDRDFFLERQGSPATVWARPGRASGATSFTGVAESVRQKFTMFSPEGVPCAPPSPWCCANTAPSRAAQRDRT